MEHENDIMFAVQQGQLPQLAVLFERYHVKLFHYFQRNGLNTAVSEDLVQDTFAKVLTYRTSFNGSSTFKSWLYGIARNTMMDQFRKHYQHPTESIDTDGDAVNTALEQAMATDKLDEEMSKAQSAEFFDAALRNLPADYRDILILSRYQQLNYQEIADLMGCNLNTMKSRMVKAVDMLTEAFNALNQGDQDKGAAV